MFKMTGIQLAVAVAVLVAISAPASAAQMICVNKIGICDRGEEHKQPERERTAGAESPSEGEQPEGEQPEGDPTGGEQTAE